MSENIPEDFPQPIEPVEQQSPEHGSAEHERPDQELVIQQPLALQEATFHLSGPRKESSWTKITSSIRTVFVALAAWIVPGLGHLLQRRIGRALAAFLAVGAMAIAGLWMRGNVFPPHGDDTFGVLGFLADVGSGLFYFLAHTIEKNGPDVSRAAGDYGTRLVATAGVLNLLFVLDALEISLGQKI